MKTFKTLPFSVLVLGAGLLIQSVVVTQAHASPKVYRYKVQRGEKKVGEVITSISAHPQGTCFALQMNVEAWLLFNISISVVSMNIVSNGIIVKSAFQRSINGNEKENVRMEWTGNEYKVESRKQAPALKTPIVFSALLMYFFEPSQVSDFFSENHLQFINLTKLGNHNYQIVQPNGQRSTYKYANGMLQSLESETTLGTVKIIRQ